MRLRTTGSAVFVALALAATVFGTAGPALADGFKVSVSDPGTFTAGGAAKQLTAVVSSDDAKRCRKARWALTIKTKGVSADQIRVARVENGQQFAARAQSDGDTIRLVDVAPDPGQVCKGRTDTAQWQIAFLGPDNGTVSFEVKAVDGAGHGLAAGKADARVVTGEAATTAPTPKATPSAKDTSAVPEAPVGAKPTQSAAAIGLATPPANLASSPASSSNTLGVGLLVGAILVLGGLGLLLWLRRRNNRRHGGGRGGSPAWQGETQMLPTGFYNDPRGR